ncbi:carboxylating nicotinate-nucleotide diphosphorylase [Candidatus Palibaumannia cicadellinicola]|uniref:Probable nicotinate-nucleotide pyrophosphorylase [carboxylating] n=1 Tax=Candidatus Palibaumannia cicadellinicola TaxID=186490 RepID=A0A088MYQ0_9GAMM|nr:carboxylating nicotinate-nucleotide diphosphorylase [Candidatus Baumannia cicadellinicola]AIN47427.1 Quinolinate phosphoribosyltransferase [Candidatus Baumannia cicadellinicola]
MFSSSYNTKIRKAELFTRIQQDLPYTVSFALQEDLGGITNAQADITAQLIPHQSKSTAVIITRENGVFCGKNWFQEVFKQLGGNINIHWQVNDGDIIQANQLLCNMIGSTQILLTGERTALNFIQTMSGVASTVKRYADVLKHTKTKLLDTRKTLPGLRTAFKYAVLCGGGSNHRLGLTDGFLIKENHIIAAGSIAKAVANAIELRTHMSSNIPIEVEVENLQELIQALETKADIIMLDNFSYQDITRAVTITKQRILLEVSGNITLKNLPEYILMGIDYISIGAFTKHVHALDLSMRLS